MNKIERVLAALNNHEVDRPPFSVWYHFGLQHMDGAKHAEAEVAFYRAYDLDFLKVMNDYPYPLPEGVSALETEDDWKRLVPLNGTDRCWNEQLSAISSINNEIGKEALFIDTVFSPWTVARKLAGSKGLARARREFPKTVLAAMENIASSLANYAGESIARGAAGIFFSLGAASDDVMSVEEYSTWARRFDLQALAGATDGRFNVLHIYGNWIHFNSVLDYPANALNWSHYATAPNLASGKSLSGRSVIGGINESAITKLNPRELTDQIKAAIADAGPRGLIIGPGCSIPTDTPVALLRSVKMTLGAPRA